ncbi:MAG: hypothetical protein K2X82_31010 [Gemmataceae bacterium]|nr:hypothetical protein [Gemmataceae bacterium]
MSRRMSFPLTLAGLLIASSAVAQPPAPPVRDAAWSFSVSRPASEPQPVQPAGFVAPEVAPAPRPANTARLERRLHLDDTFSRTARTATVVLTAAQPPCCADACGETACPAPAAPARVVLARQVHVAPAMPPVAVAVRTAAATYRPLGTWYKETPGAVVSLSFGPDGDALTAKVCATCDGTTATVTLTADCSVTKDGTIHGVITGGDVTADGEKELAGPDRHALAAAVQGLIDQPFSFRCRPADGGLMVGGVKVAAGKPVPADVVPPEGLLTGKFRHAADGKVPAPKPAPQTERVSLPVPVPHYEPHGSVYATPVLPCPDTVERIGVDFNVNPPVSVRCVGPACPIPAPATPYVVPLTGCPAPVLLPQPCPVAAPYPAPPVAVAPVTYAVPPPVPTTVTVMPAPPMPVPAVSVVARANPLPVGTWCREVGPVRMTLTIKDTTLSLATTMTAEVEGKRFTQGLLVTADCYPARDGGLVGVLTGADVVLDGELFDEKAVELTKVLAEVGKLHKALTDKPFALSYRVVDGCLMVSNVRLAAAKLDGGALDGLEDGSLIAGRYKPAGDTGATKPLKVRAVEMTLPSPRYLEPQYFAVESEFPLPREPAAQVVTIERCDVAPEPRPTVKAAACEHACPAATGDVLVAGARGYVDGPAKMTMADVTTLARAGLADDVIVTQIEVTGSRFALTTADLVALKQAGVSDRVIVAMQIGCTSQPPERTHGGVMYNSDPNVRMQQLLNQSEDLRQMGEEWRRFWFRDQPSHLTPERIHGGIVQNATPATDAQRFSFGTSLRTLGEAGR